MAEKKIKVPAGVYDMVTRCMEQEFPDHVAIRYVAEDGKTVVEKKYREYAQDIRRMVAYLKAEVPDIKGQRIVLLSRNCYEYGVNTFGAVLAGAVLVTMNQKKTWDEGILTYRLPNLGHSITHSVRFFKRTIFNKPLNFEKNVKKVSVW